MSSDDFGVPLAEFANGRTQPELAELIGVTQSAVSQMLHSARVIRVRKDEQGTYQAIEIRPVGGRARVRPENSAAA